MLKTYTIIEDASLLQLCTRAGSLLLGLRSEKDFPEYDQNLGVSSAPLCCNML